MKLKIGCCCSVDENSMNTYKKLKLYGYDYVELPLSGIAELSDSGFEKVEHSLSGAGIGCESCNLFFPENMRLTGPDASEKAVMDYAAAAFERAHKLGAKVAAFGSAAARNYPEGFSKQKALEQIISCCRLMAPAARRYGITILVEPLNRGESNIINSIDEALDIVKAVADKNVMLIADFYHMAVEHEDFSALCKAGKYLRHAHVGGSARRETPNSDNREEFEAMIKALAAAGYDGRVSIEAQGDISEGGRILKSALSNVHSGRLV